MCLSLAEYDAGYEYREEDRQCPQPADISSWSSILTGENKLIYNKFITASSRNGAKGDRDMTRVHTRAHL